MTSRITAFRIVTFSLLISATACGEVPAPSAVVTPVAAVEADLADSLTAENAVEPPARAIEETAATPAATGWKAVTVADGLMRPWAVAWLPDGTMLVTEREGYLRVIKDGEVRPEPIAGLPDILAHGQGGLMDVSLHPDFADNRIVYITYTAGSPSSNYTAMARGKLSPDLKRLDGVQVIYENPQRKNGGQHFGSRILWLADKTMLLAIGDGGNPPVRLEGDWIRKQAQQLDSHFGKTLRLDENGKPPRNNPFVDRSGARPEVWSYGHRNIQGLAMRPGTNEVWATEHGARGGDELNRIMPGANYGWPTVTYSREYSGAVITNDRTAPGMVNPFIVWTPCIAPSGLAFYTGEHFPEWQGDLLAGGLVLRQIRLIDFEDGKPVGEKTLQFEDRIRDVRQGPDGYLYVLTDETDGRVLRIEPA